MILILRQLFDPVADALARTLGPVVRSGVIEQWFGGCRIDHRIGPAGVDSRIEAGGLPLLDPDVHIVLNRLRRVSVAGYHNAAPPDAAYALAEATAVLWSCLEGLSCPVLNSMTALGLVGRPSHPLAHAGVAHRCGLLTREYCLTTRARAGDAAAMHALDMPFADRPPVVGAPAWYGSATSGRPGTLWIVGDQVAGALDGVPAAAVLRFARTVGLGFGVVTFEEDRDGCWRWTGFDPLPLYAPPHAMQRLAAFLMAHAALA